MRYSRPKKEIIPDEPILLTKRQLAAFLNVSEKTIETWEKGGMPVAFRINRMARFDRKNCLEWLQKKSVEN